MLLQFSSNSDRSLFRNPLKTVIMKNPNHKREQRFPFAQRFLTGLIIALSLSLTAFEWTAVKILPSAPEQEIDSTYFDDDLILPPLTYQKEKIKELKPPKPTIDFIPVDKLTPEVKETSDEKELLDDKTTNDTMDEFDFVDDGPDTNYEPDFGDRVHVRVELFAHYNECSELRGEELKTCSEISIINEVKRRFKITDRMNAIGGRQAVLMSFVIDKKGNITDIKTVQSQNKYVAKAAKKAIESLPQMNPAKQQGRAVALQIQIPIVVSIE